jgi:hypothetical protein
MRSPIGVLILTVGLLTLTWSAIRLYPYLSDSPSVHLQTLWTKDLENLKSQLPTQFYETKTISFLPTKGRAESIAKELKLPLARDENGKFKLEILFDIWDEGETLGAFFQYDLIDEKGNTVFEISRTIVFWPPEPVFSLGQFSF